MATTPDFDSIDVLVNTTDDTVWQIEIIERELYSNELVLHYWWSNQTGYGSWGMPVYRIDINYTIRVHKLTNYTECGNCCWFDVQFTYWNKFSFKYLECEDGIGYVEEYFDNHHMGPCMPDSGNGFFFITPYDWVFWLGAIIVLMIWVCVKDGKGKKDSGNRSRSKKSVQKDEEVSDGQTFWDWQR